MAYDIERVLQHFSDVDPWPLRSAFEGTLITGAPGGGKTSCSGRGIAYSFLRTPRMGGIILVAKSEETTQWIQYAKACGREKDLIIFNAESGHVFDPIFYEWNRPGRGSGDLENIIDLFSTLMSVGKEEKGQGHDPFWQLGTEKVMRNTVRGLDLAEEPVSIANMDRFITSMPSRPGEYEEERWQKESYCAHVINRIRERKDTLTAAQWHDLEALTNYVLQKWPAFDERPRSSLEMTWSGLADKFLFEPYFSLFSSGRVSFVPEQATHEGKILIVDFPMLQYGETGRLINVLMKLIYQRALLRRDLESSDAPVFIWQDEFQYFVTPKFDNFFQQTCRGSRVAVVCLTQNILNLAETLGEHVPGSKTKAFLANLALKIAHQQCDPETNEYMSSLIGQQFRYMASYNSDGKGDSSAGGSTQRVPRIEPTEFSRLKKPDGRNPYAAAIVFNGGTEFNATGTNTIKVLFSRNIN